MELIQSDPKDHSIVLSIEDGREIKNAFYRLPGNGQIFFMSWYGNSMAPFPVYRDGSVAVVGNNADLDGVPLTSNTNIEIIDLKKIDIKSVRLDRSN